MRVRALLVLLVSALAVLLPVAAAGPAAAGGPTSVLMSSPVLGRTSSLYTSDAGYQALADYVGAFESGAGRTGVPTKHAIGNEITLTWLIHDVSVWRVDRIYLDAAGGPWIATQELLGGSSDIWSAPVRWHRSGQAKALVALLDAHGLTDGSAVPSGTVGDVTGGQYVAQDPDATDGRSAAGSGTSADPTTADDPAGPTSPRTALALVVGLLVGAGATAAGAVVLARRRAAEQDRSEPVPEWAEDDLLSSTR